MSQNYRLGFGEWMELIELNGRVLCHFVIFAMVVEILKEIICRISDRLTVGGRSVRGVMATVSAREVERRQSRIAMLTSGDC